MSVSFKRLLLIFMFYLLIFLHFQCGPTIISSELANVVTNTESISISGNPSKGECMVANLEEKNKDSKVWQHGRMNALDWLRIFRNLEKLTSVSVSTMLYFVMV